MRKPTPRPLRWLFAGLWACAIFYVSSRPGSTLPGGFSVQGHVIEYFVLAALLAWALATEDPGPSVVVFAVLLASIYGVSDEFHQSFVVGRTPDVVDWVLDTAGATAGAIFAVAVVSRSDRKRARMQQRSPDQ